MSKLIKYVIFRIGRVGRILTGLLKQINISLRRGYTVNRYQFKIKLVYT